MEVSERFLNDDPLLCQAVGGMFFYSAEPSTSWFGTSFAIGAVSLPGPAVAEITKEVDRASLMIMKTGVPVALELINCTPEDQIEEWLKEKISDNGWVYDPDATIKMIAEMGIGEQQSVTYEELSLEAKQTNVKFKPHFSKLTIKRGDLVIWRGGTETGAPLIVTGAKWKKKVQRMQKPQPNYFKMVKINDEMIDPKYARGFGVSKFGLRGIEVLSTDPPGRDNDPYLAAIQAREQRKKEIEKMQKEQQGDNGNFSVGSGS